MSTIDQRTDFVTPWPCRDLYDGVRPPRGISRRVSNMSITRRVMIGFAIVGLLICGVSLLGVQSASTHGSTASELGADLTKTQRAERIRFGVANFSRRQAAYALDESFGARAPAGKDDSSRRAFLASAEKFVKDLAAFRAAAAADAKELVFLGPIEKAFSEFMTVDAEVWSLYQGGSAEAKKRAEALVLGRQIELTTEIAKGADTLVAHIHEDGAATAEGARAWASTARALMVGFGAGALALAALLAFIITRSIARPLARLRDACGKAAEGDLTVQVGNHSNDDVGQISRAFDVVLVNFRDIVGRVNEAAKARTQAAREMGGASHESGHAEGWIAEEVLHLAEATQKVTGRSGVRLEAESASKAWNPSGRSGE
jgi:methyl-accepting chemotaxis protein